MENIGGGGGEEGLRRGGWERVHGGAMEGAAVQLLAPFSDHIGSQTSATRVGKVVQEHAPGKGKLRRRF